MSRGRNLFEPDNDPAEELPLFETVQRQLADNEVDETLRGMSDHESDMALTAQFSNTSEGSVEQNIASLKREGLWATARFFERLLEKQQSQRTT